MEKEISGENSDQVGNAIKTEYLVTNYKRTLSLSCLSEDDRAKLEENIDYSLSKKRMKVTRKLKGQNKDRPITFRENRENVFCPWLVDARLGEEKKICPYPGKCDFQHDYIAYLRTKPDDISGTCYIYSLRGHCPRGVSCRFGKQHLNEMGENIVDKDKLSLWECGILNKTLNSLLKETQIALRKKSYDFTKSKDVVNLITRVYPGEKTENIEEREESKEENMATKCADVEGLRERLKQRDRDKKKIDWKDKLYLAPLTTLGNLPFRRVCRGMGADVTCGEMAMANNLLQGHTAEWALIKRHASENIFGVQLCGNNHHTMTRCAQLLEEQAEIDFIDINLGCPLPFVHDKGSGSGLLRRPSMLTNVVRSMNYVLDIPLTVKTRTGISNSKNTAHLLMPMLNDAGVSLITVHGRSKEQRYSKNANWKYIEDCAKDAAPTPLFGNGDIFSYVDYEKALENCPNMAGVMIGRGALIKPWIFTEIKERRHMDPTSSERLDMLKQFVHYGLEHWGSDTRGVETTRRFLLEWLSFLHRYIPTGILIAPPQMINIRPSHFKGRDDLETLMASPGCSDWIRISEMLLGPVPEGFSFLPKHKASAWK